MVSSGMALVSSTVSTCPNQSGSPRAYSTSRAKWFRPRGVEMKMAQPPFSARMGRRNAQAFGSAIAYSENTTPTGGEPTSEL